MSRSCGFRRRARDGDGGGDRPPRRSIWSAAGRPFDPAWQAVDLFPSQLWGRMLGRGWRRHQATALERHWLGLPALRNALVEHLRALRGVALGPDQVMITSGMADTLALVGRAVSKDGEVAGWVEDPGLGTSRHVLGRQRRSRRAGAGRRQMDFASRKASGWRGTPRWR